MYVTWGKCPLKRKGGRTCCCCCDDADDGGDGDGGRGNDTDKTHPRMITPMSGQVGS